MATPTTPHDDPDLIPTRVDIHHVVNGERHAGPAQYCWRCNPEPNPRPYVVPAVRRGDYAGTQMTTQLATREDLIALCEGGPYTAPTGEPLVNPARLTRVLWKVGRRWFAGVVETTTRGAGAPRVAYVHPADLATARAEKYPVNVRRVRPRALYALDSQED